MEKKYFKMLVEKQDDVFVGVCYVHQKLFIAFGNCLERMQSSMRVLELYKKEKIPMGLVEFEVEYV